MFDALNHCATATKPTFFVFLQTSVFRFPLSRPVCSVLWWLIFRFLSGKTSSAVFNTNSSALSDIKSVSSASLSSSGRSVRSASQYECSFAVLFLLTSFLFLRKQSSTARHLCHHLEEIQYYSKIPLYQHH